MVRLILRGWSCRLIVDRAILHTPFVPFTVLYTKAIQWLDTTELSKLEYFAESLRLAGRDSYSRLYELLCQAARLYIDSSFSMSYFDSTQRTLPAQEEERQMPDFETAVLFGMKDWYYGNQLMNVLDDSLLT